MLADLDHANTTCHFHPRRTRSWSPPSLADTGAGTRLPTADDDSDDAPVLFDACRFPRPAADLLDWVIRDEPWQEAETANGVRIVGEAEALKRLFSLPLSGTGEAICLHRLGDCLLVLDAAEDPVVSAFSTVPAVHRCCGAPVEPTAMCSPRAASSSRCHVRVEADMVRVYPSTEKAEPVDIGEPEATTAPAAACCEWRVREGLSLVAVTPHVVTPSNTCTSGSCNLADLRSAPPRLLNAEPWLGAIDPSKHSGLDMFHSKGHSLPAYHRSVTEDSTAVLAVPLDDPVETEMLVDAWFTCCLVGSPSLLCFFVDHEGICRGCRFVAVSEIPLLSQFAQAYRAGQRCLAVDAAAQLPDIPTEHQLGVNAFDPKSLRESSHALLELLINRCDHDGGHCLVMPSPLGLHFLDAKCVYEDEVDEEVPQVGAQLAVALRVDMCRIVSGGGSAAIPDITTPTTATSAVQGEPQLTGMQERLRRAHVTQALLMYHAGVRLAQARPPCGEAPCGVKGVPIGSRWTAKSCRYPLRVRQMMLRAARALRAAGAVSGPPGEEKLPGTAQGDSNPTAPLHRRFLLLLASSCEFLADSFLAEDSKGDDSLDIARYLAALRHLRQSSEHLVEYMSTPVRGDDSEEFTQSVRRLEERVLAKRTNAHLCLARLRQRQPWRENSPAFRTVGLAMKELDAAEALVAKPPRVAQPQRAPGPHESSLLASISKWKADLLHELATLAMPGVVAGADLEPFLREYLEAQQRDTQDLSQPLSVQCERWLQSAISLSLRGLHQLAALPSEVASELQLQARARLACAYADLGRIYASTGRYTKAMTHAKQGIELFTATKDKLQAAKLQLWLCRLQLRLAVPQAAPAIPSATGVLEEPALLRGLSAASGVEDAACTQVAQALQRVLKGLDSNDIVERAMYCEGQTLLGRVLLRQGLIRLAHSTPFCAVCHLCEEDSALPGVLELLQGGDGAKMDAAREALDLLMQASACFRETSDKQLSGLTNSCLAATYFCGRQDARVHRLALTHCQRALENLGAANAIEQPREQDRDDIEETCNVGGLGASGGVTLSLAIQLLEAKALRKGTGKGGSSRTVDARAAVLLCDVALRCCQLSTASTEARGVPPSEQTGTSKTSGTGMPHEEPQTMLQDGCQSTYQSHSRSGISGCIGKGDEEKDWVRTLVLASDEQKLPLMTYLKQELSDLLLRLLRGNERQEGPGRELKALYCSLLTAWHADTGQAEVLLALRAHARGIVAAAGT